MAMKRTLHFVKSKPAHLQKRVVIEVNRASLAARGTQRFPILSGDSPLLALRPKGRNDRRPFTLKNPTSMPRQPSCRPLADTEKRMGCSVFLHLSLCVFGSVLASFWLPPPQVKSWRCSRLPHSRQRRKRPRLRRNSIPLCYRPGLRVQPAPRLPLPPPTQRQVTQRILPRTSLIRSLQPILRK